MIKIKQLLTYLDLRIIQCQNKLQDAIRDKNFFMQQTYIVSITNFKEIEDKLRDLLQSNSSTE